MIPDSENPLDGDRYDWPVVRGLDFELLRPGDRAATLNGVESLRDLRPWPVRFEERLAALEERVRRLEAAAGQPGRRIVMLYWREDGQLATMRATVVHVKPDAPAVAVGLLRSGQAAWVEEEAAEGVVAEVMEGKKENC